jgi:hypothetical protein
MKFKYILLVALAVLALSLASIGATAPALAGGRVSGGDFHARLSASMAGSKPGVAPGSNGVIGGAKIGIAGGDNNAIAGGGMVGSDF